MTRFDTARRCIWLGALLVATTLMLFGCQRIDHVQYVVPATNVNDVLKEMTEIALRSGFKTRESVSKVKGTLAYFSFESSGTSFVDLGVRQVDSKVVVDLILRTAGLRAKEYAEMKLNLEALLHRTYGAEAKVITEQASMIPIER